MKEISGRHKVFWDWVGLGRIIQNFSHPRIWVQPGAEELKKFNHLRWSPKLRLGQVNFMWASSTWLKFPCVSGKSACRFLIISVHVLDSVLCAGPELLLDPVLSGYGYSSNHLQLGLPGQYLYHQWEAPFPSLSYSCVPLLQQFIVLYAAALEAEY